MKLKLFACSSIRDELLAVKPRDMPCEFLEYGYHRSPGKLVEVLQRKIDQEHDADVILLGYGLCSNSVVGLAAKRQQIIVPRVHDCISLLLGSRELYDIRFKNNPGTYYLSKGWIEYGSDPYKEYLDYEERYGEEAASWMIQEVYRNYTHLCLIRTQVGDWERLRQHARKVAEFMRMQYEEVCGSLDYLRKLVEGRWDDSEFVRVHPGEKITQIQFL